MVMLELVEWVVARLADFAGWRGAPVAALATILVVAYYFREGSRILVGIARWLRIGGIVAAGLVGLLVVGLATGALSLDSGIIARLIDGITAVAGGSS